MVWLEFESIEELAHEITYMKSKAMLKVRDEHDELTRSGLRQKVRPRQTALHPWRNPSSSSP
jgi:hypothetical protein